MNTAAPRLAEWFAMWREALPGFEPDSMWSAGRERWVPMSTQRFETIPDHRQGDDDVAFEILGLPSPDGRYVLDIDAYMAITPAGEDVEAGGEPDSRTVLIDRRARTESLVSFCGTPCAYRWGAWLSPVSFVVAFSRDADDFGQWEQGWLTIYSLKDSTATSYQTRAVPVERASYGLAWKAWILRRYRALKSPRTRT